MMALNDFSPHLAVFDGIRPFSGPVDDGFLINFLGLKTALAFRSIWRDEPKTAGGCHVDTELPSLALGEGWFEYFNWVAAAREARGCYVMMTLGACYGAQAVGSYLALQALNPMPAKLVAVDGEPENIEWTKKHFLDNGIDPDDHWIIQAALSDSNEPVLFPVGSPGSGAQNCISTNSPAFRQSLCESIAGAAGKAEGILYNILLHNNTAVKVDLAPDSGYEFDAVLRFVSALTLADLLAPYARVDYIEADLQQSESVVFPPAMAALTKKVRRVHLGTHGAELHQAMHTLFQAHGWDILFSFAPNRRHDTAFGSFELTDGILTAVNPKVAYED